LARSGLFQDEKEAARAYDRALVRLRGRSAATNFQVADYREELADYHRMQTRMLHNDARWAEIAASPAQFDRWVKSGCEAFPDLAAPLPNIDQNLGIEDDAAIVLDANTAASIANAAMGLLGQVPAAEQQQQRLQRQQRDENEDMLIEIRG
jgi:hypothetical protein